MPVLPVHSAMRMVVILGMGPTIEHVIRRVMFQFEERIVSAKKFPDQVQIAAFQRVDAGTNLVRGGPHLAQDVRLKIRKRRENEQRRPGAAVCGLMIRTRFHCRV